jgi:hypothetical protein
MAAPTIPAAPPLPELAARPATGGGRPLPEGSPLAPARCPNCGAAAEENFCPRCGQHQHDYHRSLGSIFGEALDAIAGWDAKIPATLGLLLVRPGRLTREFLDGRRTRYLRPLRLYLTLSLVCFLALRYGGASQNVVRVSGDAERGADTTAAVAQAPRSEPATFGEAVERVRTQPRGAAALDSAQLGDFIAHRPGEGQGGAWQRFKLRFKDRLRTLGRLPTAERERVLREAFFAKLGNMFFCLLPVFALLLRTLYRKSRLFYAEHFVFALHVHAFAMAAMTVAALLPKGIGILPILWMPVYLFVALRTVYGGSRARTAVRFVLLGGAYFVALIVATGITGLAAVLFG